MNKQNTIKEFIHATLHSSRFAVLATEGDGQPHASLIAITPAEDYRKLIFATYRDTRKYRNLSKNSKVAVLIECADDTLKDQQHSIVLSIIGHTEEIIISQNEVAYKALLNRHPQMESFMFSPDCALFLVIAESYQVVYGIDEIRWIAADDLEYS